MKIQFIWFTDLCLFTLLYIVIVTKKNSINTKFNLFPSFFQIKPVRLMERSVYSTHHCFVENNFQRWEQSYFLWFHYGLQASIKILFNQFTHLQFFFSTYFVSKCNWSKHCWDSSQMLDLITTKIYFITAQGQVHGELSF